MAKLVAPKVSKGPMLRRMDQLARDPDTMRKAKDGLKEKNASILNVGLLHRYVRDTQEEREHLEHWIKNPKTAKTLREGFIKAAERGLDLGLPVDSYWVCAGSQVEVAVLVSPFQVTMLIIGPYPGAFAAGEAVPEEGIEIVR